MKKVGLILFTIVLGTFMLAGTVKALPFDSIGWVDPYYNNTWNKDSFTGTARYYFYWDNPVVKVTELDLQFEGDIFNLAVLDAGDFTVIAPPGWTTTMYEESGVLYWSLTSGAGIDYTKDPIILEVNYTLLSGSRYYYGDNSYAGEANIWQWNEAQGGNSPWVQKYLLYGYGSGSYSSGGSTAPIPEPGTLLLLGSGLIGVSVYRWRRMRRK